MLRAVVLKAAAATAVLEVPVVVVELPKHLGVELTTVRKVAGRREESCILRYLTLL